MSLKKTPFFELRSGSVDTLLFVLKTVAIDSLRDELARRFEATPAFFANDTVALDLRRLEPGEQISVAALAELLGGFRMRPLGVVARADQHEWAMRAGLPLLEARDRRGLKSAESAGGAAESSGDTAEPSGAGAGAQTETEAKAPPSVPAAPGEVPVDASRNGARAPTTVIDRPLRSGQQIYAHGDLVVLALVSNGAEIIAEGNIHIYAPLRGRALAGVHGNHDARIFCTCLEPELISIAGIYRTSETPLAPELLGKSVQVRLDDEKLIFEPLRLT
jgi:septum site-determining protein MinC